MRRKLPKRLSVEVYHGPSMLDGKPIVAVMTGLGRGLPSTNMKTGFVSQLWILSAAHKPSDAVKSGADASVCGNCPHRHSDMGTCYVLPFQAPNNVYRTWKEGRTSMDTDIGLYSQRRLPMRLGAYGDPAAVPFGVLQPWMHAAPKYLGYTHQWHLPVAEPWKGHIMASVDTELQALKAQQDGWRTFRVSKDGSVMTGEIVCPASEEAGYRTTCAQCKRCGGSRGANVTIKVHGNRHARFNMEEK